jgi:hypothetical protein
MHPGYDGLADLAERELELVRTGRFDALPGLWEERRLLAVELPPVPPPEARDALERAAELQGRTTGLLQEQLTATAGDLRRLVTGRAAMNGYAPAVERVRLVDQAG